jgi:hypothetical protein
MSHKARHKKPSASARAYARGAGILGVAAVAAGAGIIGTVAPAGAATTPLSVTLSSCGTGSSATWNSAGDPVLTAGTANAGDCGEPAGQTYDPAYAQLVINKVGGLAVPISEPTFDSNNYSSGTPRFEVDLNNGHELTGYPSESKLNGTDMAWTDSGSPNTYTSWSNAYKSASGQATTVKDAYIVEDDSQPSGTANTLTHVQFNGQTLAAVVVSSGQISNFHSGKCLDVADAFGTFTAGQGLQQWTCGAAGGEDQHFTLTTEPDGLSYLTIGGLYVTTHALGAQMTLVNAPTTLVKSGPYYKWASLVMDVRARSLSNGAVVQGYTQQATNNANQQWSLP